MSLSSPFIRRPIATILLTIGVFLSGVAAFFVLPVSPLPSVDLATIAINASLAGASPSTMASSVATPLERRLGARSPTSPRLTSSSSTGSTRITMQFNLGRDINGAARDVQAAIAAARVDLPATLRSNPTYQQDQRRRRADHDPRADVEDAVSAYQIFDAVSNVVQQKLSAAARRRRGPDRRRRVAGGPRRRQPAGAGAPRPQPRGRPRRARRDQSQPAEGLGPRRRRQLPDLRPAASRRSGERLSRR